MLRPYDVLFVPLTPIATLNQIVDQYINKMVPTSTFPYNLNTTFKSRTDVGPGTRRSAAPHAPCCSRPRRGTVFILFKRKTALLTLIGAGFLAALFWVLVIRDPAYQVTAKVPVKIGAGANPRPLLDRPPATVSYFKQDVNSEGHPPSSAVIAQVVDYFKMDQPSEPVVPTGVFPRIDRIGAMEGVRNLFDKLLIAIGLREEIASASSLSHAAAAGSPSRRSRVQRARGDDGLLSASSGMVLNKLLEFYQEFRRSVFRDVGSPFFETRAKSGDLQAPRQRRELRVEPQHRVYREAERGPPRSNAWRGGRPHAGPDRFAGRVREGGASRGQPQGVAGFRNPGRVRADSFPSKIMLDSPISSGSAAAHAG